VDAVSDFVRCSLAGTYWSARQSRCLACQEGAVCGGGKQVPLVAAGYYAPPVAANDTSFDGLSLYQCTVAGPCVGGVAGTCAGNMQGIGCSLCPKGYYVRQRLSGICEPCKGAASASYQQEQQLLGLALFVCLMVLPYLAYKNASTSIDASPGVAVPIVVFSASFTTVLTSVQTLMVWGTYTVDWPPAMRSLIDSLSFTTIDMSAFKVTVRPSFASNSSPCRPLRMLGGGELYPQD
jgi:hypothetical protein